LPVASDLRELIDLRLRYDMPIADADFLTDSAS
jgi:hypothetical protein